MREGRDAQRGKVAPHAGEHRSTGTPLPPHTTGAQTPQPPPLSTEAFNTTTNINRATTTPNRCNTLNGGPPHQVVLYRKSSAASAEGFDRIGTYMDEPRKKAGKLGAEVVKRPLKRPAPRLGRKLTETQNASVFLNFTTSCRFQEIFTWLDLVHGQTKGFRRALFPDAAAENCIFPVPRSLFGAAAAEFWSSLELQQQICGSFRGVWLVVQGFVKQFGCFVQCVLQLQLQCCILLAIIHPDLRFSAAIGAHANV
ncbi:hypothetical protein Patl1_21499 [Pistacia atlantica]|uniref:Uncharacterized protein n=1 Tax=Pistacia atlantica TaxID=434234 RepID=A0ACC1BN83_9ROSI|nr:hypothetical protein Patl1_21499 [Pistacia atlantica]